MMSERQILRLIIFGSFSETRGSGGFLFDSFSDFSNSLVPRPNFIRPLGGYLTIKDKIVVKIANIDSDDYILHDLRTELIKIFSEAVNLDIGSVSLPPSDIGAVYPKTLERQRFDRTKCKDKARVVLRCPNIDTNTKLGLQRFI